MNQNSASVGLIITSLLEKFKQEAFVFEFPCIKYNNGCYTLDGTPIPDDKGYKKEIKNIDQLSELEQAVIGYRLRFISNVVTSLSPNPESLRELEPMLNAVSHIQKILKNEPIDIVQIS
jgi:hypothetical protein